MYVQWIAKQFGITEALSKIPEIKIKQFSSEAMSLNAARMGELTDDTYEQNLMAEYHIRYGGYGDIGYYHVSDTYIALFSHFIPCGVYEATYLLDGLLKNLSDIQPDTVHGDTHSQSETVFGLSYLLGIELMPRIRRWKKLTFYRSEKHNHYEHIDGLFTDTIDWELIRKHFYDMLRIAIS